MTAVQTAPTRAPHKASRGSEADRVVIVGCPNVGKSALFNRLTGRYVSVSNYPGTTVEIARGQSPHFGPAVEVMDTPGMYSLACVTEEERVARDLLFEQRPRAVLHVIDAKNLSRMLGLTLQLLEAGLPVVLVLNMADEAEALGVRIDTKRLEEALGVPVVATVATSGRGIEELVRRVRDAGGSGRSAPLALDEKLDACLRDLSSRLAPRGGLSARARALLLLQEDAAERAALAEELGPAEAEKIFQRIAQSVAADGQPTHYHLALAMKAATDRLLAGAVRFPPTRRTDLRERISLLTMNPWAGLPLLALVLYLGLYQFVGVFGAGTCVGFLEDTVFGEWINPWVNRTAEQFIPWQAGRDLVAGEYGIITLGLRYAVALILPVVGMFFLAFSILEDSGYLPRLAMLIDRVFKRIGLNGRAVIPLVLGFGCDTMATVVTRTLETKRERVIATLLLALAVPCSAQMGLIIAILAVHPGALGVWAAVVAGVALLTGTLAARLLPGERPSFYMELPPLRLPRLGNVLVKTYTRLAWYFKEILPMFILISVLIWVGNLTGLFPAAVRGLGPVMRSLGLPEATARALFFGFFRRDYGAAGLHDLHGQGLLSGNQLAVAAIALTLFLPCVAQFLVMLRERGWKATLLISAFICAVAYGVGLATHLALTLSGVQL